jgi:putative PIN family toxin of toxin-antitoxin system
MVKKIIIADTNWWISLVLGGFDNDFARLLEMESLEFVSCQQLETEIQNTFKKEKLQKFFSEEIIKIFWLSFRFKIKNITLVSNISICRDPKDNYLLALAKDADADYLITGDKDLLVLERFEKTIICTLPDFLEKHFNK